MLLVCVQETTINDKDNNIKDTNISHIDGVLSPVRGLNKGARVEQGVGEGVAGGDMGVGEGAARGETGIGEGVMRSEGEGVGRGGTEVGDGEGCSEYGLVEDTGSKNKPTSICGGTDARVKVIYRSVGHLVKIWATAGSAPTDLKRFVIHYTGR